MDSIGSFLKEFKNHLANKAESELEDAFTETKESLYKNIQEFYDISGCPSVLYEPCVHIKDLQFLQNENCKNNYTTLRRTLIESKRGIYTFLRMNILLKLRQNIKIYKKKEKFDGGITISL